MIKLENVTYSYSADSKAVLNNLNISINAGESVCVMGSNGSGKSTFAKLITALIRPDRGHLSISNGVENDLTVGLIFQDPDNQMVAVVVENELAFSMENLGFKQEKMENLINKSLKQFDIEPLRRRVTSDLSGGEKQRVALASVMIAQPDILILDEPDSFLDEYGKKALENELNNIKNEKPEITLIHITQYPKVSLKYDRLVVFHNGEIVADNKPATIFENREFCYQTGLSYNAINESNLDIPALVKPGKKCIKKITTENLYFNYSTGIEVLKDINSTFNAGEITGIVGYSGSGKSTMAMLLSGLFPPGDGKISYYDGDNQPVESSEIRGKITALFQQPEKQFFLASCREEISFGPKNFGMKLNENEIKALFDLVGLDYKSLNNRDPLSLSGGEKRRLAFASIISMDPDFILFDEPTCGLDPVGVGRFMRLAQTLSKNGKGLIIISHDGGLLYRLADNIMIINEKGHSQTLDKDSFFSNPDLSKMVSTPEIEPV